MHYRVAIQQAPQLPWQWRSTVLSSLNTLFQFLRLYSILPQDRLRVFSSTSREDLEKQLVQENKGLGSNSVTAAQFLQERLICSPQLAQRTWVREERSSQERASIVTAVNPPLSGSSKSVDSLDGEEMSLLERKRLALESGADGDHDLLYRFTEPSSLPEALAWMNLLVRVRNGELQP